MRKDWHSYFIELAKTVSSRATCPRASVGAVVVRDRKIIGTGYNGAPKGKPHCLDVGCAIHLSHCIRSIHAEVNALFDAKDCVGATIYCTHLPCIECCKLIVQSGISTVIYDGIYVDDRVKVFEPEVFTSIGYVKKYNMSQKSYLESAGIAVHKI